MFACFFDLFYYIQHILNTRVGDNLMYKYSKLKSFDTSELINLISVGDYWMAECKNLLLFNTSGLINLTSVGNNWMH